MDSYNENGVFPSSLTSLTSAGSKYFKSPIRCHYRPRSFIPMVLYLVWTYCAIPLVIAGLKSVFGTGIMSIVAGLLVLVISKLLFISYSVSSPTAFSIFYRKSNDEQVLRG